MTEGVVALFVVCGRHDTRVIGHDKESLSFDVDVVSGWSERGKWTYLLNNKDRLNFSAMPSCVNNCVCVHATTNHCYIVCAGYRAGWPRWANQMHKTPLVLAQCSHRLSRQIRILANIFSEWPVLTHRHSPSQPRQQQCWFAGQICCLIVETKLRNYFIDPCWIWRMQFRFRLHVGWLLLLSFYVSSTAALIPYTHTPLSARVLFDWARPIKWDQPFIKQCIDTTQY